MLWNLHALSRKPQYRDVYRKTKGIPQCACFFEANCCLRVHKVHLTLASRISGYDFLIWWFISCSSPSNVTVQCKKYVFKIERTVKIPIQDSLNQSMWSEVQQFVIWLGDFFCLIKETSTAIWFSMTFRPRLAKDFVNARRISRIFVIFLNIETF